MKDYGFLRVAAAVPVVKVASVQDNVKEICRLIQEAADREASLVVFPELSVTGSTCGDIFYNSLLIDKSEAGVSEIREFSLENDITIVVGAPVSISGRLYNCSIVIRDG